MHDVLDLLKPHANEVFTGKYYKSTTPLPSLVPEVFDYEIVDVNERHYQTLFSQVVTKDAMTCAIMTCDDCGWSVGTYVKAQDGKFYSIIAVQTDYNAAPKQAFRMLSDVAGVEYVLRLSEQKEPRGLQ